MDALIKQTLSREGKIAAIKLYRDYNPRAGLADAKQHVERLEAGLPPGVLAKPPSHSRSAGFDPNNLRAGQVVGLLFLAGLSIAGLWAYQQQSSSGNSSTPTPSAGNYAASSSTAPSSEPSSPRKARPAQAPTVADTFPYAHLSATSLYNEYKDNEVAADAEYNGKVVVVNGVIRDIGKDLLDTPYIVVGGQGFLDGVQCMFPKVKDSPLARVSKGDTVAVKGRVTGKMGNVVLSECQLGR